MSMHAMAGAAWLTLALAVGGCADEPVARSTPVHSASLSDGARAQLEAAAQGRIERGFEDDQLRFESALPGFGGIARDTSGRLVLWGPADRAEPDIRTVVTRESAILHFDEAARLEITNNNYDVRVAAYSFSQLVDWKERMSLESLGRVPGVIGVDADERVNRLTVFVGDDRARSGVLLAADGAAIPRDAINFEQGFLASDVATLRDKHTSKAGGIQLAMAVGLTASTCTLGFNVRESGSIWGMLTVSHCSVRPIGSGAVGDTVFQNNSLTSANTIGLISVDPAWNQTQAGCGGVLLCTAADAMYMPYNAGVGHAASVKATASVGINNAGGSISVTGVWSNQYNPTQFPYVGESVDKQGRTSGWTRGTVAVLCANQMHVYRLVDTAVVLCDNRVDGARAGQGDSGSPVFNVQGAPPGSLYPYGILHTRYGSATGPGPEFNCTAGCQYWFSGVMMILGHVQKSFFWYD
jgi:hypothetical protein